MATEKVSVCNAATRDCLFHCEKIANILIEIEPHDTFESREDKGDREGILHTHPIP